MVPQVKMGSPQKQENLPVSNHNHFWFGRIWTILSSTTNFFISIFKVCLNAFSSNKTKTEEKPIPLIEIIPTSRLPKNSSAKNEGKPSEGDTQNKEILEPPVVSLPIKSADPAPKPTSQTPRSSPHTVKRSLSRSDGPSDGFANAWDAAFWDDEPSPDPSSPAAVPGPEKRTFVSELNKIDEAVKADKSLKVKNVPDDGSCLFYTLLIALFKSQVLDNQLHKACLNKFKDLDSKLKEKYNEVEKKELISLLGDLAHQLRLDTVKEVEEILKLGGYLGEKSTSNSEEALGIALDIENDGIPNHNRKIEKLIRDDESFLNIYKQDLEKFEQNIAILKNKESGKSKLSEAFSEVFSKEILQELKTHAEMFPRFFTIHSNVTNQKFDQLSEEEKILLAEWLSNTQIPRIRKSCELYQQKIDAIKKELIAEEPKAEAFKKYIELSKNSRFHGGFCHFQQIAKKYGVNLIVWQEGQLGSKTVLNSIEFTTRQYNNKPFRPNVIHQIEGAPILQMIHVNGNHFMYVEN